MLGRQVTIPSQQESAWLAFFRSGGSAFPNPMMNDLSENQPADEKQGQLQAAIADFKQAKAAVKAARKTASEAKEKVRSIKADLKKPAAKKSKKPR